MDESLIKDLAEALWRIEGNYNREGSGPGSRFEGKTLDRAMAEYAVKAVREHDGRTGAVVPVGAPMMAMFFSDADPVILCLGLGGGDGCGHRFKGDAAVDAWRSWYSHLAEKHPGWGE